MDEETTKRKALAEAQGWLGVHVDGSGRLVGDPIPFIHMPEEVPSQQELERRQGERKTE